MNKVNNKYKIGYMEKQTGIKQVNVRCQGFESGSYSGRSCLFAAMFLLDCWGL